MRGSEKERAEIKAAFSRMSFRKKLEYIYTYYKLPLFTAEIALIVLITTMVSNATKKVPVLYTAYANVSFGEVLDTKLTSDYLKASGKNVKKQDVYVYRDLYLTEEASGEDHQYAYASKIKVLGAISAKQMDVMLMNSEAYYQMSVSGFLLDLSDMDLPDSLRPYLASNEVILEDNAIEYRLGEAEEYTSVSETVVNAVEVSEFGIFRDAGISGDLYAGIIANTPRQEESLNYILYLHDADQ